MDYVTFIGYGAATINKIAEEHEVYIKQLDIDIIKDLAFHVCLHPKTREILERESNPDWIRFLLYKHLYVDLMKTWKEWEKKERIDLEHITDTCALTYIDGWVKHTEIVYCERAYGMEFDEPDKQPQWLYMDEFYIRIVLDALYLVVKDKKKKMGNAVFDPNLAIPEFFIDNGEIIDIKIKFFLNI